MSFRRIDFLRPPSPPRIGWWLLAAGIAALLIAHAVDRRWTTERDRAHQAELQRAEALRASQRPAIPSVPSITERRLQQARADMQRPYMPTLRAIESAAVDPVYLLSLSFEPSTSKVRIDGEAPNFEHAVAFAQVLADGQALASATLASHETVTDPISGRNAVRFTVTARWSSP